MRAKTQRSKATAFLAVIAAIAMAFVMLVGSAGTAFAATTSTQTITKNPTDHDYTAYEIFKGTQSSSTGIKLGDIEWGDDIDSSTFITNLKADETVGAAFNKITTSSSAADVANVIAGYNDKSDGAKAIANIAQKSLKSNATGTAIEAGENKFLESGYYLIVDTTTNPSDKAFNSALLQVTGHEITIEKKYTVPSADKTIERVASPTGDETNTKGSVLTETPTAEKDSATAEVGDVVTFQLKTTLPSNLSDYDTYNLKLEDTLSAGLTFKEVTSVKIGTNNATRNTSSTVVAGQYIQTDPNPATEGGNGNKLTIEWSDIKTATGAAASTDVIVTYTAVVNENAVTGTTGNSNSFTVTYSNNPNGTGTGTSTPDVTKVYTFKLTVTKHDDSNKGLAGAGFVIKSGNKYYKLNNNVVTWVDSEDEATEYKSDSNGAITAFSGLAAGTYTLHEKTTPAGYTTAADTEFTITATPDSNANTITLNVSGVTEANNGDLTTTVVNKAGSTLPSTGGIGTTIFYVIGGLVVAGAVVALAMRRRKQA